MNERRLRRLEEQIKQRVAQIVMHEMADPRRGLITIIRVKLDREMATCKVSWSVLGDEVVRRTNERMLDHARAFIQREVAHVLHTRTVPHVHFEYDSGVEGALRVTKLLKELAEEREANERARADQAQPPDEQKPLDA